MVFDSRSQAGILLGEELKRRGIKADIVFGLARGGIVVAAEAARILMVPLEVLVVRKIGAPANPEFAVGAVAEISGSQQVAVWWDEETLKRLGLDERWQKQQIESKKLEISDYRQKLEVTEKLSRPAQAFALKTVILVDDGAATGISMMAALKGLRAKGQGPRDEGRRMKDARSWRIVAALPVASTDAAEMLKKNADEVVILHTDSYLGAVGAYYRQFEQVTWEQMKRLLKC